ncbi:hypothetical protein ES5_01356 [Dietzia cinnamea P4]|nr:hypothetical protein ES5_01356 [Dietzia cinnamea P4]
MDDALQETLRLWSVERVDAWKQSLDLFFGFLVMPNIA